VLPQIAHTAEQEQPAYPHDRQSRDGAEYGVELLRKNVLGKKECYESEQKHADRVSKGYRRTEDCRVPGRTARAHEIRSHHRLAVAGGKRVRGAQTERDGDPDHQQPPADLLLAQQNG